MAEFLISMSIHNKAGQEILTNTSKTAQAEKVISVVGESKMRKQQHTQNAKNNFKFKLV